MSALLFTWVNGQPGDSVSVFDRGLAFGDGLFETMLAGSSGIPLLEYHRDRMAAGAQRLGIAFSAADFLADLTLALDTVRERKSSCFRLKYILTRGESHSGYAPNPRGVVTRVLTLQEYDLGLVRLLQQQGVRTCTCQWRVSFQPALAGIKHLNRLDQVMARQEYLDSDCFEGLMRDPAGNYIEGTMSNLFAVTSSNEIITPQLSYCGVEGVMRQVVVSKLCPATGKSAFEAEILRMDDFCELFITNSLIGIVPVIAVDNHAFSIGPVTRSLQQALKESRLLP